VGFFIHLLYQIFPPLTFSTRILTYHEKITEINSYKNNSYTPLSSIEITVRASRIINTNFRNKDIVLLADSGQFIVNPAATAKYYYELEKLNSLID
jgi:hypothetical protein